MIAGLMNGGLERAVSDRHWHLIKIVLGCFSKDMLGHNVRVDESVSVHVHRNL